MRRALAGAALALGMTSALLTGCSGDDEPPASGPTTPVETSPAAPAWNPCSGLRAARVSKLFAATYDTRLGTADAPTCTFSPQTDGEPVVDVNYQTFPGSLTELLATFGEVEQQGRTRVTSPRVRGAADARLIIDISDETFVATAFVRNGLLVQILNVLDPAPYDRATLLRGLDVLMTDAAANAESSGLTR